MKKKRRVNKITVDPEKLEELSIDINNLLTEYKENLSKITDTIINIEESEIWNGKDSKEFTNNYNSYKPYFDKVEKLISDYRDYLKNISITYKVLEDDYSNKNIDE